jgi:hypothetical protein
MNVTVPLQKQIRHPHDPALCLKPFSLDTDKENPFTFLRRLTSHADSVRSITYIKPTLFRTVFLNFVFHKVSPLKADHSGRAV